MKPFWFDEFERMNRLLRSMMESPAAKLLQDVEKQRQLLEPPGYAALLEWQNRGIADSQRLNESFTSSFSSVMSQYELLKAISASATYPKSFATDIQRSLRAFQPAALPVVESFTASLFGASRSLDAMRDFERTFAGRLLGLAREVADAPDIEVDERVDNITKLIGAQIAQSRRGPVSLEAWIQIILALILYFQAGVGSQRSEERVMSRLQDIETQLKALAPIERVEKVPELRLVAAKALRVRSDPAATGEIVGKLTQNTLVRLIAHEKSWARVEYFDYIEGRTREGWVSNRYLKELPAELLR